MAIWGEVCEGMVISGFRNEFGKWLGNDGEVFENSLEIFELFVRGERVGFMNDVGEVRFLERRVC